MERICRLLNDALSPYHTRLSDEDASGQRLLTVFNRQGAETLKCQVSLRQLEDRRLLVDLVDGLHRDLQIAEGRLQPCVIAALQHQKLPQGTFA
ncbi:DUF3509 domain-containing protein [Pseudomonas cremoricolorata]|uniref:DUF3509 domain-containing protein n=1 Tax=Pseudomonas cremoricolorata TaxID=157783 RepID=A0A089WN49_9PSED|nr:DUF3509 domain-containing protein [Pseudomonas cremoricolorata]AIR87907.1 hypothetical protein LK03_01040 [Pseudomonas cremoricolorata]